MHGFFRHLPEYRQARDRGERDERDRVLTLLRLRKEPLKRGRTVPKEETPAQAALAVLEELERAVRSGWRR